MSPHPAEPGPAPEDHLLARPCATPWDPGYDAPPPPRPPVHPTAPSGRTPPSASPVFAPPSSPATTPLWPLDPVTAPPLPAPPAAPSGAGPVDGAGAGRRGRRLPLAVLALLVLASAGGLVFLLRGPAAEPAPGAAPPGLAMPVLPARSPGAGDSDEPGTEAPRTASPAPS
ncbi:hypothetical protein ACFV0Q_41705, partial [Streptomyces sp. NPDC059564]